MIHNTFTQAIPKSRAIYFLLFSLFFGIIQAQPDGAYIKKLTGEINPDWIISTKKTSSTQTLIWKPIEIHGFQKNTSEARKEAILSQPWSFYAMDVNHTLSEKKEVELPHQFDKNRNYNAAWYITKYTLGNLADKRCILKLNRMEMFTLVYVNEQRIGHHFGAFTPFEMDITDALADGENTLAIFVYDRSASVDDNKLYNQMSTARLSQGKQGFKLSGGINDIPRLEMREKVSIQDVFVKTSTRNGELEIEYQIANPTNISSKASVSFELIKWPKGEKVAVKIPETTLPKTLNGIQRIKVKWNNAELWSPNHPNLYVLRTTLKNGKGKDVVDTRFGFREFWVEGKKFMLNGIPIRLRGESHYHPMSYDVDFHREVFKLHKRLFDVNACRIHAFMPPGDIMLGADEAGILLIDQSAVWSVNGGFYANGGDWLLKNLDIEFREWIKRDRNCPSVVIWDVENEMLRFNYDIHLPWISQLRGMVEKFDTTRPINYSGAGWFSNDQQMVSLHMQDHYTRIMTDWNEKGTKPLIMGEFWIGGRANQRLPHAPEFTSVHQRYLEEAKLYERNLLEMRYKGVAGLMPFRISLLTLFQKPHTTEGYHFTPPNKLEIQTQPKDVLQKIRHAMQPVTVFFWPRQTYTAAQKPFERTLVLCNDGETAESFEVSWKWEGDTGKTETITMKPGERQRIQLKEPSPQNTAKLMACVTRKGELISADTLVIHPIEIPEAVTQKPLQIFKSETLATLLTKHGFNATSSDKVPTTKDKVIWIIPEHADNRELSGIKPEIMNYLNAGGKLICLKQDQAPSWFPIKFQFWSALLAPLHTYEKMGWKGLNRDLRFAKEATILASSHSIFAGINDASLLLWDKFDGRVSDDVLVRPSDVNKYEQGNWRPLATASIRSHVSLAEMFYGNGTLLACQLNLIDNLENVQAKKLLVNIIDYLSNEKPATFTHKIAINGTVKPIDIARCTGADITAFENAKVENKDVMIAFDGADLSKIKAWAEKGGRVMVLSSAVSNMLEGCNVRIDHETYLATKIADHSLLYGVSSANFLKGGLISGYFETLPENAKVLLQAFKGQGDMWKVGEAGPALISVPHGKGEILLSTIDIPKQTNASAQELLSILLTNSDVSVPYIEPTMDDIAIKKTVPIKIDGNLDEWLDDMDDRLVSPYNHAQPIHLTSEQRVEGPAAYDLNLSGINYFMWNEKALFLAGVVFSETKNALSTIEYGAEKNYEMNIRYNNDVIHISFQKNHATITLNGKTEDKVLIKTGQIQSKDMTDATILQFRYIEGGGHLTTVQNLVGETFELSIPWEILKSKPEKLKNKAMIMLESKDSKIQLPLSASTDSDKNWLNMIIKTQSK